MPNKTSSPAFFFLAILLAACSSESEDSTGAGGSGQTTGNLLGSCDTRTVAGPSGSQCRDWVGDANADLSVSCDGLSGVFSSTEACPAEGRVGQCSVGPTLGMTAIYGYYAPEYSTQSAEENCLGLDGTFEPEGVSGTGGAGGTSATGGTGGTPNTGGTGGTPNTGGTGGSCPPECFRPYECAASCSDTPVNYGCCPCPQGMIDTITCGN